MEDKIDVHKRALQYQREIAKLEADKGMSPKDKELVLRFVWDCKMGKTTSGRSRKKVGEARIMKYVQTLRIMSGWIKKPLDEVTQEEMEKLVYGIEENVYKNRQENYTDETKADYKKTLRKFYKWLGKPGLVEFISLAVRPKDVPALKREEVETMISGAHHAGLKAAIMVMFDGGLRIEELLNLRNKDLTNEKSENDNTCLWVDVRYSKTFARKIPLPLCAKLLEKWLEEHPSRQMLDAQLFPFTYPSIRKRLKTLAEKTLKKSVNPHMLRHSSATYWAAKMNRYQLCAKYGWAFSSDMPDRYIKRKGIIFDEIADKGDTEQTHRLEKENRYLKDKIENLEQEQTKLKKALEFIMPVIMDDEEFKRKVFEKRKEQLALKSQNRFARGQDLGFAF